MHTHLFDAIPDALLVVDEHGCIVMANRMVYRLFGYEPHELVGRPVEILMPENVMLRHEHHRKHYARQPRERAMGQGSMELLGRRADGSTFPVEIALSPMRVGLQNQTLASIRDVTNTATSQRVLRKARHDATLAEVGHRILTTESETTVLRDVAAQLADAVGLGPVWLLRADRRAERFDAFGATLPPRAWIDAHGEALLASLAPGRPLASHGGRLGAASLPPSMASGIAYPLVATDHTVAAALAAFSRDADAFDVDVQRLLETASSMLSAMLQRRASAEALAHAQRLEAIGKLTGGVAHDFNNLLTVISGSLQLLEPSVDDDPEALETLASAIRAVEQGAALTRKLLSFAGRQHLRPAVVSLGRQMRDLERLVRASLGERIHLHLNIEPGAPPAYVDPALLDSVVLNLVLNARDAINGTGDVEIAVRDAPEAADRPGGSSGGYVALSVRDSGAGMSADALARAWEPFFTTKPAGRGTGLGLSMAYGFIHQSGGHAELQSQPGKGTCVTLYLPVATETQQRACTPRPALVPGGDEVILVVEDDDAVRQTVTASLKALGYHVIATASQQDALECVETLQDIALLFSDLTLEGEMTGDRLAHEARRLRPDLAVLLTSGYPDAVQNASALDYALLPKPYHRDELANAVRGALVGNAELTTG
ncbi:ATP-binding protein [Cognatilysobacter lacus]|uniref:histidine kinase n=1 Tax=Cognatilysobacter lacus TaxID=1643323 RepID=A0A5D8Z7A4_9GAMM|nr:ATP-binding protein [Lysobacter lacus]TZF90012.1 PAS domain S-box protein [Lysobacter lacus]